jgi:hypothetical protein
MFLLQIPAYPYIYLVYLLFSFFRKHKQNKNRKRINRGKEIVFCITQYHNSRCSFICSKPCRISPATTHCTNVLALGGMDAAVTNALAGVFA